MKNMKLLEEILKMCGHLLRFLASLVRVREQVHAH